MMASSTGPEPLFDVAPFLSQEEGQHFDRKSLVYGPPGEKQPRGRREVRDQVARYVAGFANAEGGVLMVGNRFRPVSQYPRFS